MTDNALLAATMAPLLGRIRWLSTLTGNRDPETEYAEHLTLCDAIYSGNADLAGALAFAHIERGGSTFSRSMIGMFCVNGPDGAGGDASLNCRWSRKAFGSRSAGGHRRRCSRIR